MRSLWVFLSAYPLRTVLMLLSMLTAGIVEGLSLGTLLPLLSIAVGQSAPDGLGTFVVESLSLVGLEASIAVMLSIVAIGVILRGVLQLVANRQVGFSVARIATRLRLDLLGAQLGSSWRYFVSQSTGALANSLSTEAYRAATGFQYAAKVFSFAIQAIVSIGVALLISWQATIVSCLIGGLFLLLMTRLVRSAGIAGQEQTTLLRKLLSNLTGLLGAIKPLRAMGKDSAVETLLRNQTAELESALRREVTSKEALRALQEPMITGLAVAGMYFALVHWGLQLSEVLVLVLVLVRTLGLSNKAQREYQNLVTQESAYWSLKKRIVAALSMAEPDAGRKAPKFARELRLANVHLTYDQKIIFEGVSAVFPAGSFTAIVGPSGAGKSSILDLICGMVRPDEGQVLVDGTPLSELDLTRWRKKVGYVAQDNALIQGSILSNVLIGAPPALDAQDAMHALNQAGLQSFIATLADKEFTVVGEQGSRLSGGERQRVALGRALVHGPELLLLDEPTSALDPQNEELICELLRSLAGRFTIIAVTHQPSLAQAAERVYRIENGEMTLEKARTSEGREAICQSNMSKLEVSP